MGGARCLNAAWIVRCVCLCASILLIFFIARSRSSSSPREVFSCMSLSRCCRRNSFWRFVANLASFVAVWEASWIASADERSRFHVGSIILASRVNVRFLLSERLSPSLLYFPACFRRFAFFCRDTSSGLQE